MISPNRSMNLEHEVPYEIRKASKPDPEYACYVAPDGRSWHYTGDPYNQGVEYRHSDGSPIFIAVWLEQDEEL